MSDVRILVEKLVKLLFVASARDETGEILKTKPKTSREAAVRARQKEVMAHFDEEPKFLVEDLN